MGGLAHVWSGALWGRWLWTGRKAHRHSRLFWGTVTLAIIARFASQRQIAPDTSTAATLRHNMIHHDGAPGRATVGTPSMPLPGRIGRSIRGDKLLSSF